MSYTEFTEKYLLSCNCLAYFQVISAIPRNVRERTKATPKEKTDFLRKDFRDLCNLLKMKRLLKPTNQQGETQTSTKRARDLQVDHIPLK